MALATFDYPTAWGSSMELEQAIKTAKFGNGQEQTVADGINATREIWSFSLFGTSAYVMPAYGALRTLTGKPFSWTAAPGGRTIQVRATEIRLTNEQADAFTLTAKFSEDFTPVT